MAFTYTRTYTKQERLIKDLNKKVGLAIRESFDDVINSKYPYYAINEDGTVSDEKPVRLYGAGMLVGDDFIVRKEKGFVGDSVDNICFVYFDEVGEIHSFGEDYGKAYVSLANGENVGLLEFSKHSEVEEYIEIVSRKFDREKYDKKGHGL